MCARSRIVSRFSQFFAVMLGICGFSLPAASQSYTAVLLHPQAGYITSAGHGIGALSQVGMASNTGPIGPSDTRALLWFGSQSGYVDLNPSNVTNATAYGVWENYQVGSGSPINSQTHALMWAGTAASVVDLHPAGFTSSVARDVSATGQVGIANSGGRTHAMLWQGTAASAVDLHSSAYLGTFAAGLDGNTQVGNGTLNAAGFPSHALLWRGTAESVVDLNPAGFSQSAARDVSGDIQVGDGKGLATNNATHALLWRGTAESVVDLHPQGFSTSAAWGVDGNTQVGFGDGRALLWHGTASSVVDLHSFLAGLPTTIVRSIAQGVNSRGDVIGHGFGADGAAHALLWVAIPEPSTSMLFVGAALGITCRGRVFRRRTARFRPVL